MVWKVEYLASVQKDVKKFDAQTRLRIKDFIENRLAKSSNPRDFGHALKRGDLGELWRYRIGDYRVLCKIADGKLTILVVTIGHRKEVYK